ncbi:phage tail sheath family protein [Chloroflexus sp.]|uniref:phage tail sheath family protein n=1 Tax=Chloroflexus sp. TaxID=1904827 RepID=UPI00298F298D|nr:phage tail sheath C-terminal domain-containing protein [Chloroflexus sp.]MCS6886764.1 phage tail sheath subtilisin-like domain-containing protein [Chloroflexus sp.]MDW8404049.1 phage tail sheath subtilisin-like domain-containing protein [Chloroflexus sp.]
MPVTLSYPGVYIEEVPSGVRTITGVATSITAFVGRARRGPVNDPVRIQNFGDYERLFGGLWEASTMSYAVQHFFLNGGTDALIVRLINGATAARFNLSPASGTDNLTLDASNEGAWGNNLRISVDHNTREPLQADEFNLTVVEIIPGTNPVQAARRETFRNVSINPAAPRYVGTVLAQESLLLRVPDPHPGTFPSVRPAVVADAMPATSGTDGNALAQAEYLGDFDNKTGIYALRKADLFNLLCIPPFTRETDVTEAVWTAALRFCRDERAFLIIDAPSSWRTIGAAEIGIGTLSAAVARDDHAAIYFPRVRIPDPLRENRLEEFAPCGAVAGVFARTDAQRGVWKAPAGQDATLFGVRALAVNLTDGEQGRLNPLGVNCLRTFPVSGNVVWGARTYRGADQLASEWKYISVRRLALFIEETLYRSLQWVVFEPNDEPLWAQIRLNVGAFMQTLFRQGAFQGRSPREAYLVKCDRETTTQTDINMGVVNIVVGFAPLKPAEFVIIKIQQLAGQIE